MVRKLFVNLLVKELKISMDFFGRLGFKFNAQFTDDTTSCMIVSEDILRHAPSVEDKFKSLAPKEITDATRFTEVLLCLSAASRDEVNELVCKAVAAEGRPYNEPQGNSFVYSHGFQDLNGHIRELGFMEPSPN